MDKLKLHSFGENWFHFRKNPDSIMESLSITYCHDGTVCMTGDYGCLVWRREYFPKKPDYGFPRPDTFIRYFAEKVARAEGDQRIRTWNKALAVEDIKEGIKEFQEEGYTKGVDLLTKALEELEYFEDGDYGQFQMIEYFHNNKATIEPETYCNYGSDYTDAFKARFEMLKSVSDQILECIAKKQGTTGAKSGGVTCE